MGSRETAKRIYPGMVLLSLSLVALSAAQSFGTGEVRELVVPGRLNESGDLEEFLFNATAEGDVDMLQVLSDYWPDGLLITRASGEALVHVASFSGQLDALKFFLGSALGFWCLVSVSLFFLASVEASQCGSVGIWTKPCLRYCLQQPQRARQSELTSTSIILFGIKVRASPGSTSSCESLLQVPVAFPVLLSGS